MLMYGIKHQATYSRSELLLRSFFRVIYIAIPHYFLLYFLMIASQFVTMIAFWAILFTGQYPRDMFNFQIKVMRWQLRVGARMANLSDGYPQFGLDTVDPSICLELEYPERLSRKTLLLRVFFGFFYVIIPHGFCLVFILTGAIFVRLIAWWSVLLTGEFPKSMHDYMVGSMRWAFRVSAYLLFLTDVYPPFTLSGNEAVFTKVESSDLLDN